MPIPTCSNFRASSGCGWRRTCHRRKPPSSAPRASATSSMPRTGWRFTAPPSSHLLNHEIAVEERLVLPEERIRNIAPLGKTAGERLRPPPWREHVPVREARSRASGPHQPLEQRTVVVLGHVLEDVRKVVARYRARPELLEEALERRRMRLQAIEVGADRVIVLCAQRV